ncbi:MAG: rane protein [Bacteroidota bacterium]|nr:rane protein [Bacteroidota bacterium]
MMKKIFTLLLIGMITIGYANSLQQTEADTTDNATDTVAIKTDALNEVVVLASRVEEKIIESPITIEKLTLKDIRNTSSVDFFNEVAKLKGVHINSGSLSFPSVNTRGFATIANTRFITLLDGIDLSAPLLNFPTGNIMGLSELDTRSIEIVPGASSALYGPNAFNGTMLMSSKSPYQFPGFSALAKGGFTNSKENGTHPMGVFAMRIAQVFNKQWAIKINFSVLDGTDWAANDYTTDKITQQNGVGNPDFDGLNLYGDERGIPLSFGRFKTGLLNALSPQFAGYFGGNVAAARAALSQNIDSLKPFTIKRSGIPEELMLDNKKATSIKGGATVYKRWKKGVEVSYDYRIGYGNTVYFGSERFAFRGFTQQFHKLEIKNDFIRIMGYASPSQFGSSYNLAAVGGLANEAFKPSTTWAQQYLLAYTKEVLQTAYANYGGDVTALNSNDFMGSHDTARAFANMGIPLPGTDSFQTVIDKIRYGYFQKGGAQFIDKSWKYHAEINLDLSKWTSKWIDIQVGGNYNRLNLFTQGTIYNEDPDNTGHPRHIKVYEFGAYVQLSRKLWNDRIRLNGSVRVDKNQNFKVQTSPRVSIVIVGGKDKNHFIRASYQTGFRIPETQAQYIYFPASSGILLGGIPENAARYGIFEGGAIRKDDWDKFKATGDTSFLKPTYLNYVKPEQVTAFELGYRTNVTKKIYIDVSTHFNIYKNFETQILVYNIDSTYQKGVLLPGTKQSLRNPAVNPTLWNPYTNISQKITSWGFDIGASYNFWKSLTLSGNYTYMDFHAPSDVSYKDIAFNTPKHTFNVRIGANELKHFGFDINYRWQNKFLWSSPFGTGNIAAQGSLDAQINYSIPKIQSVIKLSGTNILAKSYRTNYGSPYIGTTFFVTWVFDTGILR